MWSPFLSPFDGVVRDCHLGRGALWAANILFVFKS